MEWQPDYLDYCESKLEEFDETKGKRKLYDKEAKAKIKRTKEPIFDNKAVAKKRIIYKNCPIGTCSTYNANKGFYRIPEHPVRRKEWLDACKLPPTTANTASICWKHFKLSDFKNEVTEENIKQCKFGQLKKNIVPSQNLPEACLEDVLMFDLDKSKPMAKAMVSKSLPKEQENTTSAENLSTFGIDMPSPISSPQPPRKVPKKLKRVFSEIYQVVNCEICSEKVENEEIYKSHILEKHTDGINYFCPYCDAKYKWQGTNSINGLKGLIHHIDSTHPETGENKFYCDKCRKGFIHKTSLDYHMVLTHSNHNVNKCELCEAEFQTLSGFRKHMAINHSTGEEPVLMCDKCDFTALHKSTLQRHVFTKHDIDKHKKCPCCEYKTPHTQKLYIHIDSQHPEYGDKKLSCEKCWKSFIYELSLKQHVSFECKFSDYSKSRPKRKQSKSQIQKSKKKSNVKCDYCCEILNGGNQIKIHYKEVHPDKPIILEGIDKFHCDYCNNFFFTKINLERHSYVKHGKETGKKICQKCFGPFSTQHNCQKERYIRSTYICDNCGMTFASKDNLKSHVLSVHEKRLDFACKHCGKRFPTLKVLEGHVKQTHTQNVKCEICDKKISNPIELRRHKVFVHKETEGAWLCEMCPKSAFFSKSTFEKHMKTKH